MYGKGFFFLNECPMFDFRCSECDQTVGSSNYHALKFICCYYFAGWKMKYVRCSATIWMHSMIIIIKPLSPYTMQNASQFRMKNENSQNHCIKNPYVLNPLNPSHYIPHLNGVISLLVFYVTLYNVHVLYIVYLKNVVSSSSNLRNEERDSMI